MAITLRAKNSNLIEGQKHSFLNTNYSSGVTEVVVANSDGFASDQYVLLGNLGNETSEIMKITGVTAATHTISFAAETTKFAHSESTRMTIIPYNQCKYYQTAAAIFSASENYLGVEDIQADSLFTIYKDSANSSGFGWFKFFNETNSKITSESNAIPYSSFASNSVKVILDSFYSLLNSKERKLITDTDSLSYLTEAYAIATSELNLVNREYKASDTYDFSITSGVSEYALPSDFSKVISLYNGEDKKTISYIAIADEPAWDSETSNEVRYYLRADYLGISPAPTDAITYTMRYEAKSPILSSYYTNVEMPDNTHFILLNFMLYRSHIKLASGKESQFLQLFQADIQRMKITSHKRSNENSSWGIDSYSNV